MFQELTKLFSQPVPIFTNIEMAQHFALAHITRIVELCLPSYIIAPKSALLDICLRYDGLQKGLQLKAEAEIRTLKEQKSKRDLVSQFQAQTLSDETKIIQSNSDLSRRIYATQVWLTQIQDIEEEVQSKVAQVFLDAKQQLDDTDNFIDAVEFIGSMMVGEPTPTKFRRSDRVLCKSIWQQRVWPETPSFFNPVTAISSDLSFVLSSGQTSGVVSQITKLPDTISKVKLWLSETGTLKGIQMYQAETCVVQEGHNQDCQAVEVLLQEGERIVGFAAADSQDFQLVLAMRE